VPTQGLARAVAAEWAARNKTVDFSAMKLTRLAIMALDWAGPERARAVERAATYAGSDLICHRAPEPAALIQRQAELWQPLVDWALVCYGAALVVGVGITPIRQPAATLERLKAPIEALDPFRLAALVEATSLTGSLVIALALLEERLVPAGAWAAADVDEAFQNQTWGEDEQALRQRAGRRLDLEAAALFLALLRA